jgi:hypothetical protein
VVLSEASLAVVKTESKNVGHGAMHSSKFHFGLANFLVQIEQRKLGQLSVNGGKLAFRLASNAGLLVAIGVLTNLNNLANKDAGWICGVGAYNLQSTSRAVTYHRIE